MYLREEEGRKVTALSWEGDVVNDLDVRLVEDAWGRVVAAPHEAEPQHVEPAARWTNGHA